MITLLLAMLSIAETGAAARPCIPIASDNLAPTSSAVADHQALRKAMGEPMPHARTMVMLHSRGGHLSTEEYSIVLARGGDGAWHGTAVGRSQIWVKDAPYSPMKRIEWALDRNKGRELDAALSRRCPFDRSAAGVDTSTPPPRGLISERIDVIQAGRTPVTYYATQGDGKIAALIRPPQ